MRIFILTLFLLVSITPLTSAKIVFAARIEEGVKGIFVMEDDGTGVTQLLTDTRYPTSPRWSPDGKQIIFSRWASPNNWQHEQIFVMNADSTNERVLTEPKTSSRHPVFSPDGKSVLFLRSRQIKNEVKYYTFVIDLESGKAKEIADFGVSSPDWSPDGKHIVFSTIPILGRTTKNLWIMHSDGGGARELLPLPLLQDGVLTDRGYTRWSPDGKKILYYELQSVFNPKDGFIPQAHRYFIYDLSKKQTKQLRIPATYRCSGLDWMDNGKSIIFSAVKIKLNEPVGTVWHSYHFYKYNISSGTFTQLADQAWENPSLDWISDNVLSVSAVGKKKVKWGALKH